jgi:hypothetical protein
VLGTTVHHAVHRRRENHADCIALAKRINADLDAKPGVGVYNHFVCHHDQIIPSNRGYARVSGANGTSYANLNYWAVCVLADERFDPPAKGEQSAILRLFRSAPNGGNQELTYHQRWFNTYCPGPRWIEWVKTIPRGGGKAPQNDKAPAAPAPKANQGKGNSKPGGKQGGFTSARSLRLAVRSVKAIPQKRFEKRLLRAAEDLPVGDDAEPCDLGKAIGKAAIVLIAAERRRRRQQDDA